MCSFSGDCGDSLCKGGCCNCFRSAIVKVVGGGGVSGCGGGGSGDDGGVSGDGVSGDDGCCGCVQKPYEPTQPLQTTILKMFVLVVGVVVSGVHMDFRSWVLYISFWG